MVICAQCGAENRPELEVCRMCGEPLEAPPPVGELSPESDPAASAPAIEQVVACPVCNVVNQAAWLFCEKCGANLHPSSSPAAVAGPPGEQREITTPLPASGPTTLFDNSEDSSGPAAADCCRRCGKPLPAGSSSCPSCAADQTIVIGSVKPLSQARLQLVVEGVETGSEYTLQGETVIGRVSGDLVFPGDDYMSGRHARIVSQGNSFILIDEGSRNGTFIKIRSGVELKPGDTILIGKQVFRFKV